jgi:TRAP-type C4-dicarboxylate transport system permease small subunit
VRRALALAERTAEGINRLFVVLACTLALAIVAVILYDVTLRTLATPPVWAHDVARYALLYLFFLALGPALASGHHVVVDMFDRLVPDRLRRWQPHAAAAVSLVFGAVLLWQLLRITGQTFADGRLAPAVIPVPLKWIYVAGPIGAAQFVFVALVQLARALAGPGRA